MSGALTFERDPDDPRIGIVTLSHPGKINAISMAMWRELGALAATLDALQPSLHAVILRGEGGDFAAGADIAEFPVHRFSTEAVRDYHERLVAPALQALLATDVPLIAQIEGGCIGGGLEIAACCDLRIAQRGARFGIPIARLGFPMAPDELSVVLGVVGRGCACELLFEARLLDADEALQRGLVQRLVDDAGAEARATAQRIAALPASVARANKRTLRQLQRGGPTEAERARHFGYAGSATHREGVQAFLGGRRPAFPDDPV